MIKDKDVTIDKVSVFGFDGAIRGMRNPKNSWALADSRFDGSNFIIGPNDMDLAKRLVAAGGEHRKFLRMIHVQFDLTLPRYLWSEFDTYHFNVKNSTSTMHKLLSAGHPITIEMFAIDDLDEEDLEELNRDIEYLEKLRKQYVKKDCPDKNRILRKAKKKLPEGFLQLRTVDTTYEELRNILRQRKFHRLPEWHVVSAWIESLPYAKELLME